MDKHNFSLPIFALTCLLWLTNICLGQTYVPDTSHLPTFKKERKVIFQDDFSQYRAGTFPGKWKIEHNVQDARSKDEWIVEKNDGSNVLKSKVSDNHYVIAQNILNSYIRNDF